MFMAVAVATQREQENHCYDTKCYAQTLEKTNVFGAWSTEWSPMELLFPFPIENFKKDYVDERPGG